MSAMAPSPARAQPVVTATTRATVLLIEDDPASRQLVERALTFAGYRVLTARQASEGVALARREQPDLILTDLNLPDLSGRELVSALRGEPAMAGVPIVAISADATSGGQAPASAAGLTGFLPKPLDIEDLPQAVQHYLNGAAAAEGQISQNEALDDIADLQRQNDARDALLRLAAHELRTPMSLILGYRQLIEANPRLQNLLAADAETRQLLAGLSSAITRMQGTIDEVTLLSRVIARRVEPILGRVKVAEAVARAVSACAEPMRQRGITLRFERVNFPSAIDADECLLDRLFRNLMTNAIRFTPDGGAITLAARVIPGAAPGGVLRFSIRDSGVGIAAADLDRIFDLYSSVPADDLGQLGRLDFLSPGLGLGLAACKSIVEAHSGRLWAESPGYDPERCPGSEFVVVLPVKGQRSA